ncbi:MAG: putative molybdenum carrier protein [Verrucomicrobiota bacterium]
MSATAAGTVVFSIKPTLTGGSKKTVELARKHDKPVLHVWRDGGPDGHGQLLRQFIAGNRIGILNAARLCASGKPEVGAFVMEVLEAAWSSS